jgi:hypothetical protein
MTFDKSRKCRRTDGKQGAFSGQSRDRQNPLDLLKMAAEIPTSELPQDEPT